MKITNTPGDLTDNWKFMFRLEKEALVVSLAAWGLAMRVETFSWGTARRWSFVERCLPGSLDMALTPRRWQRPCTTPLSDTPSAFGLLHGPLNHTENVPARGMTSVAVIAEISLRSPRKIVSFIIWIFIFRIEVSKSKFNLILEEASLEAWGSAIYGRPSRHVLWVAFR